MQLGSAQHAMVKLCTNMQILEFTPVLKHLIMQLGSAQHAMGKLCTNMQILELTLDLVPHRDAQSSLLGKPQLYRHLKSS